MNALSTVITTVLMTIVLGLFASTLRNIKNEKTDAPVLKFPDGFIKLFAILSIVMGAILLFFCGGTIISFIRNGANAENTNMFGISIVCFVAFVPAFVFYLVLKKKRIVIQYNSITYTSLFIKSLTFAYADIEKVLDYPGNKIKIVLRSKQSVSADYQMENILTLKEVFRSRNIYIINTTGKEVW